VNFTNFSLSIDEEVASFTANDSLVWISQGRWGMALFHWILPNSSAIPLISTLIFVFACSSASLIFASLVVEDRYEALIFSGFFVTSPVWLHIIEFNTLAAGAGVGLFSAAVGALHMRNMRISSAISAGVYVGFSIAIYQALVVVYVLSCIAILFPGSFFWYRKNCSRPLASWRHLGLVAISIVVAFIFYLVAQRAFMTLTHQRSAYIDSWIQLGELRLDFYSTAKRIFNQMFGMLLGADSTYLGWGRPLLILPAAGFLYGLFLVISQTLSRPARALISLFSFGGMFAAASILIIMSAGKIPTRALVGFPLLFALLALNGYRLGNGLFRLPQWAAFGYAMLISGWIGASLFYADNVARERDRVLVTRLAATIDSIGQPIFGKKIPFVLVGSRVFSDEEVARHVQIFGSSFFEHDGGNPYRVAAYFKLLGIDNLSPLPITAVGDKLSIIDEMPVWPEPGSIAVVGSVVVVKLSDITYQQQLLLK
jgi:hypothetical protein